MKIDGEQLRGSYYSPTEAAAVLDVKTTRVYVLVQQGRLTPFRIGRALFLARDEVDRAAREGVRPTSEAYREYTREYGRIRRAEGRDGKHRERKGK